MACWTRAMPFWVTAARAAPAPGLGAGGDNLLMPSQAAVCRGPVRDSRGWPCPGEGRRNQDRSREAVRCGMPLGNPLREDRTVAQPLVSDALWQRLAPLLP